MWYCTVYPLSSISETSCRYDCLLHLLSLAACNAFLELNGIVSSITDKVESSIDTRSGLADDIVISRDNVEGGESEALKLGISTYKAEKGVVSYDVKQLSTKS